MSTRPADQGEYSAAQAASSGIAGLDAILRGGFPRDEVHLVQGGAGTGKTTLALQYLLAGAKAGETGLYFTLSQSKKSLEAIARSHGWSLDGVAVHELPGVVAARMAAQQTVLPTADVELGELTREFRATIEECRPRRVVFDSIGVIGLLSGGAARFRREIVTLGAFLADKACTTLFIGESVAEEGLEGSLTMELGSIAASVTHLEQRATDYGEVRRRVRVIKVRSVPFLGGYHDFRIETGGIQVFARLGPILDGEYQEFRSVPSSLPSLDELLGGGLERGTACLFVGAPGVGKSTLAGAFVRSFAEGGGKAAIFLFDERPETWKERAKGVGLDLTRHVKDGRVAFELLDPAQISPGEFACRVRDAVDRDGAGLVVIDSLTGYFNAMNNAPMLVVQMHELLLLLSRRGVLTILIVSQEGLMNLGSKPVLDVSYLSDSIIALRMFEAEGVVRRCLAAVKKRQGESETTIRELFIQPGSVRVGEEPLRQFRSVLGGAPEIVASGESGGREQEKSRDA